MSTILKSPLLTAGFGEPLHPRTKTSFGSSASAEVAPRARIIRIGLLGLGNVGQAFVRACRASTELLSARGWTPQVCTTLVRDPAKHRDVRLPQSSITQDAEAFFAARPDVVVEVLSGVEPAREYVAEALRRGIPVVTANKALLAEAGDTLTALAETHQVALRCEASVAAGVPFLSYLGSRPFADRVSRVTGILNGTSNFILTRMADSGTALEAALAEAQQRGLAEPDARADISGRDAAAKLTVVLQHLGFVGVRAGAVEMRGIELLDSEDLRSADRLGGTIKPIAAAHVQADAIDAFVGPAFVERSHPLAGIHELQNGICVSGDVIGRVCFSGPGAGPDVTAATLLDDVADIVAHGSCLGDYIHRPRRPAPPIVAPRSDWFVRIAYPNGALPPLDVVDTLASFGIQTQGLCGARPGPDGSRLYLRTRGAGRVEIDAALSALESLHGVQTYAIRAIAE